MKYFTIFLAILAARALAQDDTPSSAAASSTTTDDSLGLGSATTTGPPTDVPTTTSVDSLPTAAPSNGDSGSTAAVTTSSIAGTLASSVSSSTPTLAPSALCSKQFTQFKGLCCVGTYQSVSGTSGNYQKCIGNAIPLTATNFAALFASATSGTAKSTTLSTNVAAPTGMNGGMALAGLGGMAFALGMM